MIESGNGTGKPFIRQPQAQAISQHQIGTYKCPDCSESVFQPLQVVQFKYDKLKPDAMMMNPLMLMKCMGCGGYLVRGKDGLYSVVKTPSNLEASDNV